MKILLVSAALEGDLDRHPSARTSWIRKVFPGSLPKAYMVPLDLATVAGITPDEHEVVLHDETTQGFLEETGLLDQQFDLVGVTGYQNHLLRAVKIGDAFRQRGIVTVIGGAGVTHEPEICRDHFDVLFIGEAELTWPRFLEDFERSDYQSEYRESSFVDLVHSPKPDWGGLSDLLAQHYQAGGVQVSRGCPHKCEFCNIWLQFGRKLRSKRVPQVIEELRELKRLGLGRVMLCTDNFYGDPRYAKELLRELIELNAEWEEPLRFFTELTMLIARDEEMLRLLSAANFPGVFIGIESVNEASLRETHKQFNLLGGMVHQCHQIASYGLYVMGSFIVGFDSDTPAIFEQQARFIQDAFIPVPRLNVLYAGRGTALRDRLLDEGRIMDVEKSFAAVSAVVPGDSFVTNVIPLGMTRVEMYTGYLEMLKKVWHWKNFEERVIGFLDAVEHVPQLKLSVRLAERVKAARRSFEEVPGADIDAIRRILARAEQISPTFLPVMAEQIGLLTFELARLPVLIEDVERHIELELAVDRAESLQLKRQDPKGRGLRPIAV